VTLSYAVLTGDDIAPALDDVARLRISVFRDFPYLYDGTLEYERDYLAKFSKAEGAIIVAALWDRKIVGASTGCLLRSEHQEFIAPFQSRGLNINEIFYCAESVLLPEHRGKGAGPRFFALRESHARGLGMKQSTFCAVQRSVDHSARPDGYKPLDLFWQRQGYEKVDGLTATFSWKDVGVDHETSKPMQFWMKPL
jgi:GNAT superfamily N-acetyltransferase